MYYVIYVTKGHRMAIKKIDTLYNDVAVGECAKLREDHGWKAYRLMWEDGSSSQQVASWSWDDYAMVSAK